MMRFFLPVFTLVGPVCAQTLPTPSPPPSTTQIDVLPRRNQTVVAPGLSVLRVQTETERGPLRYFLVRADRNKFRLQLLLPDANQAVKKRSVRALAAQFRAPVVINGGFFAYGGAAVGAVRVNREWQRMPWKNRTALGWNDGRGAHIGALSGAARLTLKSHDGEFRGFDAAFNGWTRSGERTPLSDGIAIFTPMFASQYALKTDEIGARVRDGQIEEVTTSGNLAIPAQGFLIVARGVARDVLAWSTRASWRFTGPSHWKRWAHILGAGPLLVEAGRVKTTETAEEFRPDVLARGPRSAVGFTRSGDWLFLVVDGRQPTSIGLSLLETAQLFSELGAHNAMNLDGGSSTQLAVDGVLVNTPSAFDPVDPTKAREVMVSNALAFFPR